MSRKDPLPVRYAFSKCLSWLGLSLSFSDSFAREFLRLARSLLLFSALPLPLARLSMLLILIHVRIRDDRLTARPLQIHPSLADS
jgi:hypothetical protein